MSRAVGKLNSFMAGERGPRIRRLQGPRHLQNTPDRWTDSKSLVQDHRLGTSTTRAITAILRYRGTTCASYHVLLGPGSNIYLRDGGIGTLPAHTRPGLSASRTQNEGRGEERWVHDVFLARPGTGGPLHWRAECKLGLRTDRLSTASQRRFDPTTRTPTRVKKKKRRKKLVHRLFTDLESLDLAHATLPTARFCCGSTRLRPAPPPPYNRGRIPFSPPA